MIHQSFPQENLSDFIDRQQQNKSSQAYYQSLSQAVSGKQTPQGAL